MIFVQGGEMKITRQLVVALACVGALSRPVAAQDPLSDAKRSYDAASYSEALTALDKVTATGDVVEVEKYRALCFLALGRPKDAEGSLERLVMARPLFTLDDNDASPKLVALFNVVRKRVIPEAAKQVYQRARANFDSHNMAEANKGFKEVIALADMVPVDQDVVMGELKVLASGFVGLTDALGAKPEAPPTPAPGRSAPAAAAAVPTPTVVTTAPSLDTTYDASDTTVIPPVAINRSIPTWTRPELLRYTAFQGLLDITVGEQGNVIAATMLKPFQSTYDSELVSAAKKWKFRPATLAGRPVKYHLSYPISIEPDHR
jgi:outer membrane biosynthesis protein TonB